MKNKLALTALITLVAAVSFSQVSASGLTYDPSENYYRTYYGIGEENATNIVVTPPVVESSPADLGPHNGYYATYYGIGIEKNNLTAKEMALNEEMANPLNYYNW